MAAQSHFHARPADGAVELNRWVIALLMVGIAGAIGVSAQAVPSAAPLFASCALLVAACALLLFRGSWRRVLMVTMGLAVGVLLAAYASVLVASFAAAALAVAALITGPWRSAVTRPYGERHDGTSNLQELLRSMAVASEIRDHQTADHCDRVSRNCRQIGDFLGLTEHEATCLEWAARVHDVGKAAIPRVILQKPGPLTEWEMETVKHHSRLGADMLVAASDELARVARVVLHHHENWDGTGYPVGLSGLEIPLESRIIAIVDMYEALTSDRPYRVAMEPQDAHREVLTRSGTRFDPDVVVVFDELWRRGRLVTWSRAIRSAGVQGSAAQIPDGERRASLVAPHELLLTST